MRDPLGDELGEAEVGDERREVRVQQHVAGLDVPVDDVGRRLVVEVHEAFGRADGHRDAALPVELDLAGELAVEVREQAQVGHVVVDDHPLVGARAVAPEAQEVPVAHPGQHLHLHRELHLRLGVVGRLELLHGDLHMNAKGCVMSCADVHSRMHALSSTFNDELVVRCYLEAVGRLAPVDAAEAALAELVLLAEAIGGGVQLLVAEDPPRAAHGRRAHAPDN